MNFEFIRRVLFGERLPTERAIHERLPKFLALPVFASDAISSSAYATEEILLALVVAGATGLTFAWPVALAISTLFIIVAFSYRQTVAAYPAGGGAYLVSRDNLGLNVGLVAAAALLTDYVLTVAVSISAGVAAIISLYPALNSERVPLCVAAIALVTVANLRGAKESGKLFAPPVYLFITSIILLVVVGVIKVLSGNYAAAAPAEAIPLATQEVGLLLVLRAFASGCAALTGIEAISDGAAAFRPPEAKNAAATLLWMTVICVFGLLGITALSQTFHIVPVEGGHETVLSMLGRSVFGNGALHYILQVSTAIILILAANTAFADFPRLSSIIARDGYAPKQLANLGDRLVFSNGILLLGLASCFLVIRFGGQTHSLIPLYAVGVFVSFTLSQASMVRRWFRLRGMHWQVKALVNAIGAIATGTVLIVVASIKFTHGAWMVMVVVPIIVLIFRQIGRHYRELDQSLSVEGYSAPRAIRHAVIVLVPGLHRGVINAVRYALSISPDSEGVFVEVDPKDTLRLQEQWREYNMGIPLVVLKSPWRSLVEPVIRYTRTLRAERKIDLVTVILPEFVTTRWWHRLLHNQAGLMLKFALMFEPGVVVTNVRYRPVEPDEE